MVAKKHIRNRFVGQKYYDNWGANARTGLMIWENNTGINLTSDNTSFSKGDLAYAENAVFNVKKGAITKAYGTDVLFQITPPIKGATIATVEDKQYMLIANNTDIYAAIGGNCLYNITALKDFLTGTGTVQFNNGYINVPTAASSSDDTYNTMTLVITAGPGVGESKTISDYTGSSKTAIVSAWTETPTSASKYRVSPSNGNPQSAGLTSIRLAAAASPADDTYNNMAIYITAGVGSGQMRYITDYNGTTKQATISEPWTTVPTVASTYYVVMHEGKVQSATSTTCVLAAGEASALWTSASYDLSTWPYECSFSYQGVVPTGTSVAVTYENSDDNVSWDTAVALPSTGVPTALKHYIRFNVTLTGTDATLKVTSVKITTRQEFSTPTSIYSGLNGNKVYFENYKNRVFFCFGNEPMIWDGTTVRTLGLAAPTTAPTIADSGTSGVVNGTYLAKITYVNADGIESASSPVSGTVTVSNKQLTWTVPVGPTGVMARRLYRTITSGAAYYYVTEISDNVTTSYTDNVSDTNLIASGLLIPSDNQIPPAATMLCMHKDVMFYVSSEDESILWFSKPGNPEAVPNVTGENFYLAMPAQIRGLASHTSLVISGISFLKHLTGSIFHTDTTISDMKLNNITATGVIGSRAMSVVPFSSTGIAVVGIFEDRSVSVVANTLIDDVYALPSLSEKITPLLQDSLEWESSVLTYYNNKIYVAFDSALPNYTDGRIVLIYDMSLKQWQGVYVAAVELFVHAPWRLYGLMRDGNVSRFLNETDMLLWGKRWGTYWSFVPTTINSATTTMLVDTGYKMPSGLANVRYRYLQLVVSGDSITDETTVTVVVDGQEETISLGSKDDWNVDVPYGGSYGLGRQDAVISPPFTLCVPEGRFAGVRITDASANPLTVYAVILQYEIAPVFRGGI